MTETTAITVSDYMRAPARMKRFQDILGKGAEPYVQSVLITVAGNDDLQKCTPRSIYISALRSASLGLSLDPALKEGWLVPYNRNIGTKKNPNWVKEAQFQPHYKGLYKLAMRTGRYMHINVSAVYEGQHVMENPLTGMHAVNDGKFLSEPQAYNPAYVDVTNRTKKDRKVIGWIGYYKMKNGAQKSVYMSVAEIKDHAQKYVKNYAENPNWNDPDKRSTMEMKTVLRELLSWADKSGGGDDQLYEAMLADAGVALPEIHEADDPVLDGHAVSEQKEMTVQEARNILVKVDGGKERLLGELTVEQLNYVVENSQDEAKVTAANLILREDYNMEAPGSVRRDPQKIVNELMS